MPRDDLDAILQSLDLPPRVLERWLADLERFCHDHGGERHYRELMQMLADCRARVAR